MHPHTASPGSNPIVLPAKVEIQAFTLLLIILSLLCSRASAQNNPADRGDNKEEFSLFGSDDILNVSIALDLDAFTRKPAKTDSFNSEMTIHLSKTDSIYRKIVIKYRGLSRYNVCKFPPMQINFKKPINADSSKIKKLKLVTHCQSGKANDEYVLREYLVYKMFNVFTDTSFRVRLLRVSYINTRKDKKPVVKYGIFIEPAKMLAKRTNCTIVRSSKLLQHNIVPSVMDRIAIFNYMVSDWDWSVHGKHNIEVIMPKGSNPNSLGIAIPYDFDLTGVVNADYAIPPSDLGIETVRDPVFLGICRTRKVYEEDLKKFSDAREKIYSIAEECPYLNRSSKRDITDFLDQFFYQLRKQKNVDSLIDKFLKVCIE